jgi:hypothetical protein
MSSSRLFRRLLVAALIFAIPSAWAADVKISGLSAASSVAASDEMELNQAGTSRKATLSQVVGYRVALGSQYTNATTTGTEVSGLSVTLAAGTYRFDYYLLVQNATAANAADFGINYTGTVTRMSAMLVYADTGTTATTGTADDVITGDGGELIVAQCVNTAESTTAPNLNCITAFAASGVNNFIRIHGVLVVSDGGDLELWGASESTTTMSVEVGSNLIITQF